MPNRVELVCRGLPAMKLSAIPAWSCTGTRHIVVIHSRGGFDENGDVLRGRSVFFGAILAKLGSMELLTVEFRNICFNSRDSMEKLVSNSLHTLALRNCSAGKIWFEDVERLLAGVTTLKTLKITDMVVRGDTALLLTRAIVSLMSTPSSMQNLTLKRITIDHMNAPAEFQIASNLEVVNLIHCTGLLARNIIAALASTESKLTTVTLENCGLSDGSMLAHLLSSTSGLRILRVPNNRLGDLGVTSMCDALCKHETLEVLELSWNEVGSIGMQNIATVLETTKRLHCLHLGFNHGGDDGINAIATALLKNTSLQCLFLNHGHEIGIGPGTYLQMTEALHLNSTLQVLDIQDHRGLQPGALSAIGEMLVKNKGLQTLSFAVANECNAFRNVRNLARCIARNSTLRSLMVELEENYSVNLLNGWSVNMGGAMILLRMSRRNSFALFSSTISLGKHPRMRAGMSNQEVQEWIQGRFSALKKIMLVFAMSDRGKMLNSDMCSQICMLLWIRSHTQYDVKTRDILDGKWISDDFLPHIDCDEDHTITRWPM